MTATVFNCFCKLIVQITSTQNEKTACGSPAVGAFAWCAGGCGSNPNCAMFVEPGMATLKKITAHVATCNVVTLQKVLARELFFMTKYTQLRRPTTCDQSLDHPVPIKKYAPYYAFFVQGA